MADDPRLVYLDARAAYEASLTKFRGIVRRISMVAQALSQEPGAFIEVSIDGRKSTIHTRHDLAAWPTGEDIRSVLIELRAAYDRCREAWRVVPHDRQAGCVKPPERLGEG